jgi:hypothetical protein
MVGFLRVIKPEMGFLDAFVLAKLASNRLPGKVDQ